MDLDNSTDNSSQSNTARGIIAGVLGGLAGTFIKSTAERFLEVRHIDEEEAQLTVIDDLSEKITGNSLEGAGEDIAEHFAEIPLGVSVGAAYGYGKKDDEDINLFDGVILGATTWASTHETSLPLAGEEKSPSEVPIQTQLQELFAHVLFGVTTEIVRGFVSQRIRKL